MIRKPNGPLFVMLLVAVASSFAAEAYSQVQAASKGGSRPVRLGNLSVGAGMDYWSGDWATADINRWGPTAWASTTIWHCLGINAEGHSMIVGGNRSASNYKLFVGEGGLMCTVGAWDRFQPIYKAELGFATLTQPGNGTGHFHSTYGTWSLGGGVEIHTRGRWWTRVEYTYEAIPNFHSSVSNQNHTLNPRGISFGETYRFGRSASPPGPDVFAQETDTPQANLPGPYSATRTPVEKVPERVEKTPESVEKIPESVEKIPERIEKIPERVEKMPESAPSRFMLGPTDVIKVNVWKNTELSKTVTVGPDGFISLPLLNDIHVAGMTANEVAETLRIKLNSYIVNPQVTVSVVKISSRQVFVLGQVGKPGVYPLVGPIDVLQVIALAGGLTIYAHRGGITILREGPGGTEKLRFNYDNVIRGDGKQDVFLQPGDTVVVP